MRAVASVIGSGGVPEFADTDLPLPQPGPRDLLVRVRAAALNHHDVRRHDNPLRDKSLPLLLGVDASGTVEDVGAEVANFRPGDEVFYSGVPTRGGSFAEYQLVDERIAGPKPQRLSHLEAAALPLSLLTAYEMLFDRLDVSRSSQEPVLVIGGAGAVAVIAIQLLRNLTGLQVIATASREESAERACRAGAHHVISHVGKIEDAYLQLKIPLPRYIFSIRGTSRNWEGLCRLIAPQGGIGIIDDPDPLDLRFAKAKAASFHWEAAFCRPLFNTPDMDRQNAILSKCARMIEAGSLLPLPVRNFGSICAGNIAQAHRAMKERLPPEKIVFEGA